MTALPPIGSRVRTTAGAGTVRGCVFGAWRMLRDQGHVPADRGTSGIFDELEAAYQAVRTTDNETIARYWLNGHVSVQLDLFGAAS